MASSTFNRTTTPERPPRLATLAHFIVRHRRAVIVAWAVLTVFGAFSASQVSKRWFESFSIPGYSSYEANQRTLQTFGTGEQAPLVAVFHSDGDVTKATGIKDAISAAANVNKGSRVSSYWSTGSRAYVSQDGHTAFAEIYPPGTPGFSSTVHIKQVRARLKAATPSSVQSFLTGRDAIYEASSGGGTGPSVLTEALIGGLGALVILFFVFGTLPAVLIPIAIAISSILNTFTLVWVLTYVTNVSIIVQFLIALVGLGVAIDYALLMIFRFRDELREGKDVETALVETMTHAGRSVIVSGTTVAIGLLALIGTRINSIRVMPKRFVDKGHPEDGLWGRWARLVLRHPWRVAAVGMAIVLVLAGIGTQLVPNEAQLKNFPGSGTAISGRNALAAAQVSPGVMKPFNILVKPGGDPQRIAAQVRGVEGVAGAVAPSDWRRNGSSIVEAFPAVDGAAPGIQGVINRLNTSLSGTRASLGGVPAVDRDFIHAIYGNFGYVLAFVLIVTLILLARAFRSIVLPIKAVILNLLSLAAAYGIVVFIFQEGHGSSLWGINATQAIPAWIPLMIFAFLYGLSMDYEVFMLSRMREAYEETHSTSRA